MKTFYDKSCESSTARCTWSPTTSSTSTTTTTRTGSSTAGPTTTCSSPSTGSTRRSAYWDTYERVGDDWFFRRRNLKSWYRQEFGHPQHGTERVELAGDTAGAMRGPQMPHAFATFDPFWARPPVAPPT